MLVYFCNLLSGMFACFSLFTFDRSTLKCASSIQGVKSSFDPTFSAQFPFLFAPTHQNFTLCHLERYQVLIGIEFEFKHCYRTAGSSHQGVQNENVHVLLRTSNWNRIKCSFSCLVALFRLSYFRPTFATATMLFKRLSCWSNKMLVPSLLEYFHTSTERNIGTVKISRKGIRELDRTKSFSQCVFSKRGVCCVCVYVFPTKLTF